MVARHNKFLSLEKINYQCALLLLFCGGPLIRRLLPHSFSAQMYEQLSCRTISKLPTCPSIIQLDVHVADGRYVCKQKPLCLLELCYASLFACEEIQLSMMSVYICVSVCLCVIRLTTSTARAG